MATLTFEAVLCGGFDVPTAGAAVPYTGQAVLAGAVMGSHDYIHGGPGTVAGTVKEDADPVDLPLRRKVRLQRDVDGVVVREMWSHAVTGVYSFPGLSTAYTYTAISYDHTKNYRAVVADGLVAEVP